MFKNLLVCLDGSEIAEQVIPYAQEMAQRFNAKLILLRVIDEQGPFPIYGVPEAAGVAYPSDVIHDYEMQKEKDAKAYLQVVMKTLSDIDVQWAIPHGISAAQTIIDYVRENQVNLIILATHGRTGLKRTLLGSVADEVIRESHLPVLVVRPKEMDHQKKGD